MRILPPVLLLAYFDFRINGNAGVTLVLLAVACLAFVLPRAAARAFRPMLERVPQHLRRLVAVGLPVVVLYLTRLRGTQPLDAALVTAGAPAALAAGVASRRTQVDRALEPFYVWRDQHVPRPARIALAVAIPVLLSFLVAHGSLLDIVALFGGRTRTSATPFGRTGSMVLTAVLSAAAAYLCLNERKPR